MPTPDDKMGLAMVMALLTVLVIASAIYKPRPDDGPVLPRNIRALTP